MLYSSQQPKDHAMLGYPQNSPVIGTIEDDRYSGQRAPSGFANKETTDMELDGKGWEQVTRNRCASFPLSLHLKRLYIRFNSIWIGEPWGYSYMLNHGLKITSVQGLKYDER